MSDVKRLVELLEQYALSGDPLILATLQECANNTLINSAGYSCVEQILSLQEYGWRVSSKQVVGEPDPRVIGTIERLPIIIHYGAVMTPCQKRLMRLLDSVDEALLNHSEVDTSVKVDLSDNSVQWPKEILAARMNFLEVAKQIFFEPNARRVRFGDLVLFCKEAGINLDSSDNFAESSYFTISTSDYVLRVERSWS